MVKQFQKRNKVMKAFTDIEQSKKLVEILPKESADMFYLSYGNVKLMWEHLKDVPLTKPCWSLAALLNILHSIQDGIPILSGGSYKNGNYISDWCIDYEFNNGNYLKTFAANPVDACVAMIEKLHEQKLL